MKRNLFYLAALALSVAFTGCSSDEPATANGGSTLTPGTDTGRPIVFNAARDLAAAKKTFFGDTYTDLGTDDAVGGVGAAADRILTPIYWNSDEAGKDEVLIMSPQNGDPDRKDGLIYTATQQADKTKASLTREGDLQLTWNEQTILLPMFEEEIYGQTFVAFYPADALPETINYENFTYTVSANQTGTMESVYMYGTVFGAHEAEDAVNINFRSFLPVIELNIVGDVSLKQIEVTSSKPLAGTATAPLFTDTPEYSISDGSHSIVIDEAALNDLLTDNKTGKVYISFVDPRVNGSYFDDLTFTFTDADDKVSVHTYTGHVAHELHRLNVNTNNYTFDFPSVDLGAPVGGTGAVDDAPALYFAVGNLIASADNFNPNDNGTGVPTNLRFHIANPAIGEYVAQQSIYWAESDEDKYLEDYISDRDMFKVGVVNSQYYWTYDSNYPTAPSNGNFDGSATEDLVRYAALQEANIDDNYRSATNAEWEWVVANCEWIWTDSYKGNGVPGYIIKGAIADKSRDGHEYSDKEIFLPIVGYCYSTSVNDRGSRGNYWSGTNSANYAFSLSFYEGYWYQNTDNRYYSYALRPVLPAPAAP
jgi:hypothetical protein